MVDSKHQDETITQLSLNAPASATVAVPENTGFGPQAGPPTIQSFTAANFTSGLTGPSTAVHSSFIIGTMAARQGAPPFFNNAGGPPSASSVMTQEVVPKPACLFGRVAAIDRRPGIRRGTWSPASLGLSSSEH